MYCTNESALLHLKGDERRSKGKKRLVSTRTPIEGFLWHQVSRRTNSALGGEQHSTHFHSSGSDLNCKDMRGVITAPLTLSQKVDKHAVMLGCRNMYSYWPCTLQENKNIFWVSVYKLMHTLLLSGRKMYGGNTPRMNSYKKPFCYCIRLNWA